MGIMYREQVAARVAVTSLYSYIHHKWDDIASWNHITYQSAELHPTFKNGGCGYLF